jgi:4-hydroxythreonine-4-phosphate dehydrogenase
VARSSVPLPLALTSGEPAGVAPEITALAWQALRNDPAVTFFLIGDGDYFATRAQAAGLSLPVQAISHPGEASAVFARAIPVLSRPLPVAPVAGRLSSGTAPAVIAAIDEGFGLVLAGQAAALVTNPINKDALYAAGFTHQGHTDYLAALALARGHHAQEVMMLVAPGLRAVPVTVHIALERVARELTAEMIIAQAVVVARDLETYFGIANPRIAVTGLNPHAGENGAMGTEEQSIIIPALFKLRAAGINVTGPISADTAFHPEARATYDAILCMYHDQALIPVKTLDFHGGVNVTLGLPIVRTSPDHGTALGLAGTGTANPKSLIAALRLAADMAAHARG